MPIQLDPSVQIVASASEGWNVCHPALGRALQIPKGEGIAELLGLLAEPQPIEALTEESANPEATQALLDRVLAFGFALHTESESGATESEVLAHRASWRAASKLRRTMRRKIEPGMGLELLLQEIAAEPAPPVLRLECGELDTIAPLFEEITALRRAGRWPVHECIVEPHRAKAGDRALSALFAAAARIDLRGLTIDDVSAEARALIGAGLAVTPVMSHLVLHDVRCRSWLTGHHFSGLRLEIAPEAEIAADFLDRLAELASNVGLVEVAGLPADEVICGEALLDPAPNVPADLAREFLLRASERLRALEGQQLWAQTPEAEEKWIRPEDDLLPQRPALLGLRPGAKLADICGGLGRLSRRLSKHLGPDGTIVCLDREPVLASRGRDLARRAGADNVQFRSGLAEQLPLADGAFDAAIVERTGLLMARGLGPAVVKEMRRIVRAGGKIAMTQRLCQIDPAQVSEPPSIEVKDIYRLTMEAFQQEGLRIVAKELWSQPELFAGQPMSAYQERYLPALIDPYEGEIYPDYDPSLAVYVTVIAEKTW